jgi:hypothetical protein
MMINCVRSEKEELSSDTSFKVYTLLKTMSQPPPNTTHCLSARLLAYIGPPSAILLTFFASPTTGFIYPIAFLPTTYAYRKWAN